MLMVEERMNYSWKVFSGLHTGAMFCAYVFVIGSQTAIYRFYVSGDMKDNLNKTAISSIERTLASSFQHITIVSRTKCDDYLQIL